MNTNPFGVKKEATPAPVAAKKPEPITQKVVEQKVAMSIADRMAAFSKNTAKAPEPVKRPSTAAKVQPPPAPAAFPKKTEE